MDNPCPKLMQDFFLIKNIIRFEILKEQIIESLQIFTIA